MISTSSPAHQPMPLRFKFWLGLILPGAVLVAVVAFLLVTGSGKREAPAIVFFASLVAVPALVLANCWTLFVDWSSRVSLVLSAAVIPALFVLGALLFIHGAGRWQEAGIILLAPFLHLPMRHIGWLAMGWVAALAGLLLAARYLAARRGTK